MKPLHTKYRPSTLDGIVGNQNIVACLRGYFVKKSHPHVFLFWGERGCGKSSFARVIGNELNCQQVIYYNAANEKGIDTAREIIDSARYKPFKGENKLFIIDEVHKTTENFQNAILNILEETPSHCYFVLCTTNPEKVLGTVKDRCHQFEVKPWTSKETAYVLNKTAKKENIKVSEKIINKIVELSAGNPRITFVLLEKFISMGTEGLSEELLQQEDAVQVQINKLCQALMQGHDWGTINEILKKMYSQDTTKDPESIRRNILAYLAAVALNKKTPEKRLILLYECFKEPLYNTGKAGLTFACQYACI